jgi:hypothetical protein
LYNEGVAWDNIEERLQRAFRIKLEFPSGIVWLPDPQLTVDDWLTLLAETDEELREINIRRIRFLQNRWPIEKLVDFSCDELFNRRGIWAMYVRQRAYILFSDGFEYQLVAAIEPKDKPELYQAVIRKLLRNPEFVPGIATSIKFRRPDLVSEETIGELGSLENSAAVAGLENLPDRMLAVPGARAHKESYLSKLLVGWAGKWIDLPVLGFWHEEVPDSITTSNQGEYVMTYAPGTTPVTQVRTNRQHSA